MPSKKFWQTALHRGI